MTSRAVRLVRGTLLGGVATLLAALSHGWAGGTTPGPLALVLGTVFAGAVGTIAIGRTRRHATVRTTVAVAIAQLAFHLVFALLGTGAAVTGTTGHHAHVVAFAADPAAVITQGGGTMWLAHLAAGALTILYLHHLERHVWALITRPVIRALATLTVTTDAATTSARPASMPRVPRPPRRVLRHAIARRGPPALSGA